MNLLVCIGGEAVSQGTLRLAAEFAARLKADLSILYVGEQIPQIYRKELQIAKEKLSQWMIETPEMRVFNSALKVLREMDYLPVGERGELQIRHGLKPAIHGAFELHLYGKGGTNVRFRYREGEIVDNIRKETEELGYDLVFVGASQQRRLVHRIFQFVPLTTVIVRPEATRPTRFLLCLTGSSRIAFRFTVEMARKLQMPVELLAVGRFASGARRLKARIQRYAKLCARYQIQCTCTVRTGTVQGVLQELATAEHLVVLGYGRANELLRYFFGSLPMRICRSVHASVLVVKPRERGVEEAADLTLPETK